MAVNHVHAGREHPRARFVAAVDPVLSQGDVDQLMSGARLYRTVAEMLRDAQPQVVHICTPPSTHAQLMAECLGAGVSVYVEKPVTERTTELDHMLHLAASTRSHIGAGHQLLFHDTHQELRRRLTSIGDAVHVDSYFSFRKVRRNLTFAEQAVDILPHPTYLLVDVLWLASGGAEVTVNSLYCTPDGEVRALLVCGAITASLTVSLAGRPVDHFIRVIGTAGKLEADYIRGTLVDLSGPGAGFVPMMTVPLKEGWQRWYGGVRSIGRRFLGREGAYPGLRQSIHAFYDAVAEGARSSSDYPSLRSTVAVCEQISRQLAGLEEERDARDLAELGSRSGAPSRGTVVVTGGAGFLGREVVKTLHDSGFVVKSVSRSVPRPRNRIAGVSYEACDLSVPLPDRLFKDAEVVVHAAAASEQGEAAHQKGTIDATRNVLEAARLARVPAVIHVSSLSVLVPGSTPRRRLCESSGTDAGNRGRGPYVWAKAEAERIVSEYSERESMAVRIVRPGPIVDYDAFDAPGRLGRDLGSLFVAVGGKRDELAVVQVQTAAAVIARGVSDISTLPSVLNLVEPSTPTRGELVARLLRSKSGIRVVWMPTLLLRVLSPVLNVAQTKVFGLAKPVDLIAAFATEYYDTELVAKVLNASRADSEAVA